MEMDRRIREGWSWDVRKRRSNVTGLADYLTADWLSSWFHLNPRSVIQGLPVSRIGTGWVFDLADGPLKNFFFRSSRGNEAHYFRFTIYDLRDVPELSQDSSIVNPIS